jgi:hypothetical protein
VIGRLTADPIACLLRSRWDSADGRDIFRINTLASRRIGLRIRRGMTGALQESRVAREQSGEICQGPVQTYLRDSAYRKGLADAVSGIAAAPDSRERG